MISLLNGPSLTSIHDCWKNHSFDQIDLCWQSNISAFSYTVQFLSQLSSKKQASFTFVAEVTICSDFGAQENKISYCFQCFPIYLLQGDGTGCHDLHFLNVEFEASFFSLLFHLHQEALQFFFDFCHKVMPSAYLRLLIFLLSILLTAWASPSLAFLMM